MPVQAYSYSRISSHAQSKASSKRHYHDADSLDTQFDRAQEWVANQPAERDIELNTSLILKEVISGSTGKNIVEGRLASFIESVVSGDIQTPCFLLIDSWSRFSRLNPQDQIPVFSDLTKRGVTIVTLKDKIEYNAENTRGNIWQSFIPMIMQMSAASGYSDDLSRSSGDAWEKRRIATREKGKPFTKQCPSWLRVVNDEEYEVIPEKANTIKKIFDLYIDGNNQLQIAKKLNEENVPTLSGRGGWSDGTISNILSDRRVIGYHEFKSRKRETNFKPVPLQLDNGSTSEKIYPPIISHTNFETVRGDLGRKSQGIGRTRKRTPSNILAYINHCGYYGHTISYKGSSRTSKYATYYSSGHKFKMQPSHKQSWQVTCIEDAFMEFYTSHYWNVSLHSELNKDEKIEKLTEYLNKARLDKEEKIKSKNNFEADLLDPQIEKAARRTIYKLLEKTESKINKLNKAIDDTQHLIDKAQERYAEESDNLYEEWISNRQDAGYKAKLNRRIRNKIKRVDLFGGGLKYDKKAFDENLKQLDRYIRDFWSDEEKILKYLINGRKSSNVCPPDDMPDLSTDLFVGLNQRTYSECFYLYEIFWQQTIFKHVPTDLHMEAYTLLKRIPYEEKDDRFFVVHPIEDPWRYLDEKGYDGSFEADDYSEMYRERHVIKPKEEKLRFGSRVCKGIEWIGIQDTINIYDPDLTWRPPYYVDTTRGGYNANFQHITNKGTFSASIRDGQYKIIDLETLSNVRNSSDSR